MKGVFLPYVLAPVQFIFYQFISEKNYNTFHQSQKNDISIVHCHHHHQDEKKILIKRIIVGVVVLIVLALVTVGIVWAVLKPTKPSFVLQDATLYRFNLTTSAQLSSTFRVTFRARNPNDKIGINYDDLVSYATYCGQQITLPTSIPPTCQDSEGTNIWSPFLRGESVPIAPYIGAQISQQMGMGNVRLLIKLKGWVKYRVGSFVSGRYHLQVNCQVVIPLGNPSSGVVVGNNAIKYQLIQGCGVSV